MLQAAELRTLLSECRATDVLARLDRMIEANANEARTARQHLQQLEQRPDLVTKAAPPPPAPSAEDPARQQAQEQIDQLNHRLAAAQAEIRRCQTRLFAYEREIRALQQENAELEEMLRRAEEELGVTLRHEEPPLIAAAFPPAKAVVQLLPTALARYTPPPQAVQDMPHPMAAAAERRDTLRCAQPPKRPAPPPPRTRLEKLAAQLVERMDRLM